jgi:hypothetical protein
MPIDRAALVAGSIRLASGVSFLVDPLRANRSPCGPCAGLCMERLKLHVDVMLSRYVVVSLLRLIIFSPQRFHKAQPRNAGFSVIQFHQKR